MTGEMWKNKPPFRLALNKAASDEIAWRCKHYTGHKVMKFYESGAALAQDMGVPVSKMEESIEGSLKPTKNPHGRPYPAYPSGKSWDEASGNTGSGKKFYHNVISGRKFTSGLRGLRPRTNRSMYQVRIRRQFKVISLAALAGGGKGEGSKKWPDHRC